MKTPRKLLAPGVLPLLVAACAGAPWQSRHGGSVNGDAYDDLVVAATVDKTEIDGAPDAAGRGFVFLGGDCDDPLRPADLVSDGSITRQGGSLHSDLFGLTMVFADFNQDGHADLVAGLPGVHYGHPALPAELNVFLGSPEGLVAEQSLRWFAVNHGGRRDFLGRSLAVGDFDDDGALEIAAGAPFYSIDEPFEDGDGAVFVFRQVPANENLLFNPVPVRYLRDDFGEQQVHGLFGWALAAGDFNRDEREDLAVTALREPLPGAGRVGAVYTYLGTSADGLVPGARLEPDFIALADDDPFNNDEGIPNLAAGDFNDDGFADLAVGAPFEQPPPDPGVLFNWVFEGPRAGLVHLYRGSLDGLQPWGILTQAGLDRNEKDDQFGTALAVGDFNGDGVDDLAVGAIGEADGDEPIPVVSPGGLPTGDAIVPDKPRAGFVYVFHGSSAGLVPGDRRGQLGFGVDEEGDLFGFSLAAGDFNADGRDDLAVGAKRDLVEGVPSGLVYVFRGSAKGLLGHQVLGQPPVSEPHEGEDFGAALSR